MSDQITVTTSFYRNIGKLFFAIAFADKVIHPKEVSYLKKTVAEYWIPLETTKDAFGSDAAYQIEIVFDYLVEEEFKPYDCMDEFEAFFKENEELFTLEIRRSLWESADGIASSYAGKNKSELVALYKLRTILLT